MKCLVEGIVVVVEVWSDIFSKPQGNVPESKLKAQKLEKENA